jgi:L-2,4-diaminobutyrate transaminase
MRRKDGQSSAQHALEDIDRETVFHPVEAGVLTRPLPIIEVNSFSPPLCMSRSEAEEAVARYSKGLDAPTPDLAKAAAGL